MATGLPAGLTPGEGRKFGLTVGIAFGVLGAISYARGHELVPVVLASVSILLVGSGLLFPAKLGPVYRGWMRLALVLSKVTTPVFMGLVYFVVLTPTGLLMRLFGRDPLKHGGRGAGFWFARAQRAGDQPTLTRQF